MNIIERMEKFPCDDSDDDKPSILSSSSLNFSYIYTINTKLRFKSTEKSLKQYPYAIQSFIGSICTWCRE